eukprot:CAMPEP_0169482630 /NCGR_PEP_ID=MMETSP1042-20121227/30793_1 /TAXON_ID=464988 /ORGANISM="Hemiselmis andersenii, Strain CCMP1180" /LENGTH=71 /DNA_ID=CAMNT_0009597541 /DNA_START=138 /DNA_END=353 /DNA_ORIENTATION=-
MFRPEPSEEAKREATADALVLVAEEGRCKILVGFEDEEGGFGEGKREIRAENRSKGLRAPVVELQGCGDLA